ncbi:40S ribosomal protein S21 [Aphis craccivora]|uniref:40S ribosomal protein S21 n=1 Tax=Aphis craccivora TaxID=307492 RepID=A0A6G0ZJ93_APHCR|nr:40S ribosomal protein S21 [Aphis craccivora]
MWENDSQGTIFNGYIKSGKRRGNLDQQNSISTTTTTTNTTTMQHPASLKSHLSAVIYNPVFFYHSYYMLIPLFRAQDELDSFNTNIPRVQSDSNEYHQGVKLSGCCILNGRRKTVKKPYHPFTNGDPMSFRHVRENIAAIKINYYYSYCRSNVGILLSTIFWAHLAIGTAFKTNTKRYVNPRLPELSLKQGSFRRLVLVCSFRHGHRNGQGCRCCDSEIIKVRAVFTGEFPLSYFNSNV